MSNYDYKQNNAKVYVPFDTKYLASEVDNTPDDIFSLRQKTLETKIKLIQEQIEQRRTNLEDNLYRIDLDLCQCTEIHDLFKYCDVENRNDLILNHRLPLFRERRRQKTDYLKDTALLRRELLDTYLQQQSLKEKQKLLE